MVDLGIAPREVTPVTTRTRLPWWASVSLVFLGSRVISTTFLLLFAAAQKKNPWTGAHPGYFDFAKIWDGTWYSIVASSGYPSQLPESAGHIAQNAWAFLPGYPVVIRIVMFITGLDFSVAAVVVSVGFAWATALLFYKLMRTSLPHGTALFSVVLFCVAPLSPILQVSYAESMFAFFLTLALYLIVKRRYALMFPVVFVLAFTRPGALALALTLGLHVIYRFVVRDRDPFPLGARIQSVAITVFTGFMGIAWVLVAWVRTGNPSAYTDTELAWRAPYIGYTDLLPFSSWFQGADWWTAWWGIPGWIGTALLLLIVAVFGVFMFSPWVRKLGIDIRFWLASFVLYILAVFFPQSSTFRILMPTFPILGAFAQPKSIVYRVVIVVAFIAMQWVWLYATWWVDGSDWTPP